MKKQVHISVIIPTAGKNPIPKRLADSIKRNKAYSRLQIQTIIVRGEDVQKNRNQGAKRARGECLFFCDEDVELKPDCLDSLYGALITNGEASYSYCDYSRSGHFSGIFTSRPFDLITLKNHNYISTMSLIRAKDFPSFNEQVERLQDWDLWLTMLEQGKRGVYVHKVLFDAFYSDDGISARGKEDAIRAVEKVRALHPKLYGKNCGI